MFFPTQRDERERIQMQKTMDSLEDLESRLEGWFTDIENKVAEINNRPETTSTLNDNFTDILNKLNKIENNSIEGIAKLKEDLHNKVSKMDGESILLMGKAHTIFLEVIFVYEMRESIISFFSRRIFKNIMLFVVIY